MIGRAMKGLRTLVGRGAGTIHVTAEPDAVLLASSAALKRLGARITRYDVDAGTLEARQGGATLRLTAAADGADRSRLAVEADTSEARRLAKRFRAELTRPAPTESA
jgi:hypothetical protein